MKIGFMTIILLILLAGFCYWMYFAGARRQDRMTASLPAPPTIPPLGNALLFLGSTEKILRSIEAISELALNNKGAARFWLGSKLYISVANPEDVQIVLESLLDKDSVYRFLKPWLGHGLFIAPLCKWKSHRKVLLPVFSNKIVEEYFGVIAEQSEILVARLSGLTGKGQFDVFRYITACTLDIVFETAMGERMDVQRTPNTPYLKARNTVMEILNMRLFKVWLQPDCLFKLTYYAKQQRDNIQLTHNFTDEVVKKRRIEYKKKQVNSYSDKIHEAKPRAILDLLFGNEIKFTDQQLREHIDSITIAGNDTTALVIAYTLVLLGIHQNVQEKVVQEQNSIFSNSKKCATKEDIKKMQYLENVIKESMRLYTVVPIIARNVDKDTRLTSCGITLPSGTGVVVGPYALHRSEVIWGPYAKEFDPDRFLPERSVGRHPAAFIPFSYGSRNCIGRNLGMNIMKSVISRVIRSYRIEADDIGPLKIELLLFPVKGHQLKISHR